MKCPSVASIWPSDSPIHQKVTATAVLNNPPTLYTGGSDGSIVWWSISDSNQDIRPVAMLCGHSARITDLEVCSPVTNYGSDGSNNKVEISSSTGFGALISASKDGVLCVWSRSSGHCRCRRSLPPSTGIPSVVQVAPWDHRFVCIACHFVDMDAFQDHEFSESIKGDECSSVSREHCLSQQPSKCTILVVDSCTLTVVQTIFNGDLCIGLFRFVVVVTSDRENGNHSAVVVDTYGNAQSLPIFLDSQSQPEGEESKGLLASYGTDPALWTDGSSSKRQVVSVTSSGPVYCIIFKDRCIFGTVDSGIVLGRVCFTDDFLNLGGVSDQPHIVGGMFLEKEVLLGRVPTNYKILDLKLCVWNNIGLAVVYIITIADNQFKFKPVYHIPAIPQHQDLQWCVYLNQLNQCLVRVESFCAQFERTSLGIPRVTLWTMSQQEACDGVLCPPCRIIGEGTLSHIEENASEGSCIIASLESTSNLPRLSSHKRSFSSPDVCDSFFTHNRRAVSSSIIVSGSLHSPFVVVYGLYSGDIEVITLGFPIQDDYLCKCPERGLNSFSHLKLLSGHSGAVLCLASHTKGSASPGQGPNRVLISGGMDCTVRIWNLDAGYLVRVMHHHVTSVRQIVLPPLQTPHPWCDCFLSLAEDNCIALVSLETLQVERIFHGHHSYPSKVIWDGLKGYVACLCKINAGVTDQQDLLFIWDIITGSKDRVLRGAASQAMFDHLSKNIHGGYGSSTAGSTSVLSLHSKGPTKGVNASVSAIDAKNLKEVYAPFDNSVTLPSNELSSSPNRVQLFRSCSPYPGIASIIFDFTPLLSCSMPEFAGELCNNKHTDSQMAHDSVEPVHEDGSVCESTSGNSLEKDNCSARLQIEICRFGLSLLHLWDVDEELDALLIKEMKLERPKKFCIASGLDGDMGSLTLTFPGVHANLELWKTSSEYSAMRSLTMVSLALFLTALSHSCSASCSTLAAFYTRSLVDRIPSVRPPLLQLLVMFWQDRSQHVRMAARTLFHCAASRAIPAPLCIKSFSLKAPNMSINNATGDTIVNSEEKSNTTTPDQAPRRTNLSDVDESNILNWIESFEVQDWITCVGGTSQDETNSRIIVAAALAIWYPSMVKPSLAMLVVHPLMKVVMAMNVKYSSTAAELLAEGMESTWKQCIVSEIPNLIEDIFIQIECVNGASGDSSAEALTESVTFKETLVEVLLPCVAMADIHGFLTVIESQIWSTSSDSPVHSVALKTLVRAIHVSPRSFIVHLNKVVNFILLTMDPGNLVMRKTCLQGSMAALKEVAHVFPMVSLNETTTRLAIGDAIGNINSAKIQVYDLQSMVKVKVLDASGPPGFPNMLAGGSEMMYTTAVSALSFSPDGEGLIAFSEKGLMIRWWSLGSAWWEKLSRNITPVQCTKLIFVPPWEGFSANSSRSSIMASVMGHENPSSSEDLFQLFVFVTQLKLLLSFQAILFIMQENCKNSSDSDSIKLLIQIIDLSYRIVWVGERTIVLARHLQELGTFQL
ncbi:unnamed protein product [Rhodiola kirilowii]